MKVASSSLFELSPKPTNREFFSKSADRLRPDEVEDQLTSMTRELDSRTTKHELAAKRLEEQNAADLKNALAQSPPCCCRCCSGRCFPWSPFFRPSHLLSRILWVPLPGQHSLGAVPSSYRGTYSGREAEAHRMSLATGYQKGERVRDLLGGTTTKMHA